MGFRRARSTSCERAVALEPQLRRSPLRAWGRALPTVGGLAEAMADDRSKALRSTRWCIRSTPPAYPVPALCQGLFGRRSSRPEDDRARRATSFGPTSTSASAHLAPGRRRTGAGVGTGGARRWRTRCDPTTRSTALPLSVTGPAGRGRGDPRRAWRSSRSSITCGDVLAMGYGALGDFDKAFAL